MSEERNQYAVVPFDTFERYLGPRYENIPGVEYILENGTLLYFMEEAPGVYESADHTVTGEPAAPKLFVPVYEGDEMQPHAFAEVGPREQFAAITDFSVTIGLPGVNQRKEPGYVLDNGLVLLESERDSQGNYKAGAGMDGMFLQTGRIFEPIRYPDGEILAFLERQPERIRTISFSLLFNLLSARMRSFLSASFSRSRYIVSSSVPRISERSSSLPSQSTLRGSSIDTSILVLLFLRRYIRISFSIHLEAYVASLIFFVGLNVLIALISPIVPIEMRSSTPTPVLSNFFAI